MSKESPLIPEIGRTTKQGIDKLELMLNFIYVFESEVINAELELNKFKAWLSIQIKRELTPQEDILLLEGILKYIQSEAQTNERLEAIKFLFDAEFLND